jgi:hypothetical protein
MSEPTLHPDNTHIAIPLKMVVILSLGLLSGGATAAAGFLSVKYEVAALRTQIDRVGSTVASDLVTKGDLERLRDNIGAVVSQNLREALVKCPPYAVRGQNYVLCDILPVKR